MKLIERIDLADRRRAARGASARSDRPPGAGATRRPSRPTTKARPADRYRKCFEQVMTEIEDFERLARGGRSRTDTDRGQSRRAVLKVLT